VEVVVVGAGLGGLSAACHLRGRGHDVVVVEQTDQPGGRAARLVMDGYCFDSGPTVLTMPDLIADCFAAVGAAMADHLTLRPVDPMYRACFADGSELHVRHGREAMAAEIRAFAGPAAAAQFHRFCDWLTELYELEMPNFIATNFDSVTDLVRPLGPALQLLRMGGFGKLSKRVARFFDDPRLQRVFTFQSLYAGLAPYEALAIYCVITYMDAVAGVYVPEGGMAAVPEALEAAATKAGVQFRYGQAVTAIERAGRDGAVTGVRLAGGEFVPAGAVVCNADLPVAYDTLLPDLRPPRAARRGRYSPSCVVWHAGVRGLPPAEAAHHNIHFGDQWDGAFRAILRDGVRMPDPSILVTVASRDDPTLAPTGCSTLYVLEPTPNLDGKVDWSRERDRCREQLAARCAALGYPSAIEVEALVDPTDWLAAGLAHGTPFALAHRFFQTGPFRPANVERRVPGLVFAGSGTVPGVGVPMVLISGRLAAERVDAFAAR
jgi:phytoene desaturase